MDRPDYSMFPREQIEEWLQFEVETRRHVVADLIRLRSAAEAALRNDPLGHALLQSALDMSYGRKSS